MDSIINEATSVLNQDLGSDRSQQSRWKSQANPTWAVILE